MKEKRARKSKRRKKVPTKGRKLRVDYPKFTIDEAISIADAILTELAGQPSSPDIVANACGTSHGNVEWRIKLAASGVYGFTEGSYNAQRILVSERALAVLRPRNPEEKAAALREAASAPKLLLEIYEKYPGGVFPTKEFFPNILERDFSIPPDEFERFLRILEGNKKYFYSPRLKETEEPLDVSQIGAEQVTQHISAEEAQEPGAKLPPEGAPRPHIPASRQGKVHRVFIGHSKNESILDVVRSALNLGGLDFEIAEEEETAALPVPDKVSDAMRRCQAALINVSADEERKDAQGNYAINENVLIEIGAAFVLYTNERVILLWDKRLSVPSNVQGLYKCQYEGDSLSAEELLKLQKALIKFKS